MQTEKELVQIHESEYEEGISLKELFNVVWNWKWVVIIITLIGLFLGGVVGYFSAKSGAKVTSLVEFRWDGISKGEYPDGQRFDYGSAFNATIYGLAIDELDLDLSVNDLQKYVSVTPMIPNNVLEIAQKAMLDNINFTYYPTSFKLSVSTGNLGISEDAGQKLLTTLVDAYRTEFERKYIKRTIILDFSLSDLSTYDYIDAYEILRNQTTLINSMVNNVLPKSAGFISSELGIGFTDLSVRLDLLSTIQLNNMESRINNYLLTKDADLLITIYEYRLEQIELKLAENQTIKTELVTLIDTYKGGTSTIIIPGMDSTNQIDTEPYLNQLYQRLVDTQAEIASSEQDIVFYNRRIDRLKGNDPTFILTPEKVQQETAKVELSITESALSMSEIVGDTEILLTEYNAFVSRGLIQTLTPPQSDNDTSMLLFAAIGLVLGGMISLGVVFIIDNKVKNKKQIIA